MHYLTAALYEESEVIPPRFMAASKQMRIPHRLLAHKADIRSDLGQTGRSDEGANGSAGEFGSAAADHDASGGYGFAQTEPEIERTQGDHLWEELVSFLKRARGTTDGHDPSQPS